MLWTFDPSGLPDLHFLDQVEVCKDKDCLAILRIDFMRLFVGSCLLILMAVSPSFAELATNKPVSLSPAAVSTCSADQLKANSKTIKECEAGWSRWGIPKPNASDLR